jgi:replication fork protection complex subunit Tof1/Swi1
VVKPDNEERQTALFKDNKLRLLLTLIGFMRLGDHDDPEASWVIPSNLTAAQLQEALDLIRKYEFDPPTYEDGKGPEDMLRSKASANRRNKPRVEFDDDSDGIDHDSEEDRGEYALDGPTVRKTDKPRKVLKRRRRARTPQELDDEEKDLRAEARRKKELEKQQKVKSTIFVHDSDDEDWDEDKDAEFFAREEALRAQTVTAFKKSLNLGDDVLASAKKRKAEQDPAEASKRRKTPPKRKTGPFDSESESDGGEEDIASAASRAHSEQARDVLDDDSEDEATDTPLSSQPAAAASSAPLASKGGDITMTNADDSDDDDAPVRRPLARSMRGGFVVESDSE